MNKYEKHKKKHKKIIDQLISERAFFAFNEEQFNDGMRKLHLDPALDRERITSLMGGMFCKISDIDLFENAGTAQAAEFTQLIKEDKSGLDFCYHAFIDELDNHEYSYTREVGDALDALNIDADDLQRLPQLNNALYLACMACTPNVEGDGRPTDINLVLANTIGNLGDTQQTATIANYAANDRNYRLEILKCLSCYMLGVWGDLPPEDIQANDESLTTEKDGFLGRYHTSKGDIYIDTPLGRAYTLIMFTDEY